MSRVYLVVLLAGAVVFTFVGCGGDGGDGDSGGTMTLEEYFEQAFDISTRAGEVGTLLKLMVLGDDTAGSYAEELNQLQQSAEDIVPPQAILDDHESLVGELGRLADTAELADVASQAGDEEGLASAKIAVTESLRSILDILLEVRYSITPTPAPAP